MLLHASFIVLSGSIKAARAHEAVLQSRIDGLQNECAAHIRHIKELQRQLGERK